MVTIHCKGFDIELHEAEKFNQVRHRLNQAKKAKLDYENQGGEKYQPFHLLSFRVDNGDDTVGRCMIDVDNIIFVSTDEEHDQPVGGAAAGRADNNDEESDEQVDDEEESDEEQEEVDEDDDEEVEDEEDDDEYEEEDDDDEEDEE